MYDLLKSVQSKNRALYCTGRDSDSSLTIARVVQQSTVFQVGIIHSQEIGRDLKIIFNHSQYINPPGEVKSVACVKSDKENHMACPVAVILHSPHSLNYLLNGGNA